MDKIIRRLATRDSSSPLPSSLSFEERIAAFDTLKHGQARAKAFLEMLRELDDGGEGTTMAVPLTATLWIMTQAGNPGPYDLLLRMITALKEKVSSIPPCPGMSRHAQEKLRDFMAGSIKAKRPDIRIFTDILHCLPYAKYNERQPGMAHFLKEFLGKELPLFFDAILGSDHANSHSTDDVVLVRDAKDNCRKLLIMVKPGAYAQVMDTALANIKEALGRFPSPAHRSLAEYYPSILDMGHRTNGSWPSRCLAKIRSLPVSSAGKAPPAS